MSENSQAKEWAEHQQKQLTKRLCPDSGEPLIPEIDAWKRNVLMCELCDCFGYDPNDKRLGPKPT